MFTKIFVYEMNSANKKMITKLRNGVFSKFQTSKVYSIMIVGFGVVIVYICRLFTQMYVASRFGAGYEYDSFNVALVLPNLIVLVFAGSLERVFLPIIVEVRTKIGANSANVFINTIMLIASMVFFVISIILVINMSSVISIVAPGLNPTSYELTVNLAKLLIWVLLPMGLALPFVLIFNVDNKFGYPVFFDILRAIIYLLGAILLTKYYGIFGLAYAFILSVFIKILLLFLNIKKTLSPFKINFAHPFLFSLFQMWIPIMGIQVISQVYPLIDRYYASQLGTGAISYLSYSYAIADIPNAVIGYSIGVVIFPSLAKSISIMNFDQTRKLLKSALYSVIVIGVPILIYIAIIREPLVSLLLERGKFVKNDTLRTANILLYYIGYSFGGMMGSVTSKVIWSLKTIKFFFILSLINIFVYIGAIQLFFPLLGVEGLALSLTIMFNVSWILQLFYIQMKIGGLKISDEIVEICKWFICWIVFFLVVLSCSNFMYSKLNSIDLLERNLLVLFLTFITGVISYLFSGIIFRVKIFDKLLFKIMKIYRP